MYTQDQIDALLVNADISVYKSANETQRLKVWRGLDVFRHTRLIYIFKEMVRWAKDFYVNTTGLDSTANYLYTLINAYIGTASLTAGGSIIGGGGANSLDFVTPRRIQFKVGDPGALMAAGASQLTISESNILFDSIQIMLDGVELPVGDSDRPAILDISYNENNAIVQFNFAAAAANEFIIRFLRGTTAAPASSSTSSIVAGLPDQLTHEGEELFTDGTNPYWASSVKHYRASDFEPDGITLIKPELDGHRIEVFFNNLSRYLISDAPDNEYTLIEGGGFVINLEGFNAKTKDTDCHFFVHLLGKNDA